MTEFQLATRYVRTNLRLLPLNAKFYLSGKKYPYYKESFMDERDRHCVCHTLAERTIHGQRTIRRINVRLSAAKEVYIEPS